MASDMETCRNGGAAHLVSGIVTDGRELVRLYLALLRAEIRMNVRKAQEAGLLLVAGVLAALAGSLLCSLMMVHLLSWVAPALPLWSCFGIVGTLVGALGGTLAYAAVRKIESIKLVPNPWARAFEEAGDGR